MRKAIIFEISDYKNKTLKKQETNNKSPKFAPIVQQEVGNRLPPLNQFLEGLHGYPTRAEQLFPQRDPGYGPRTGSLERVPDKGFLEKLPFINNSKG